MLFVISFLILVRSSPKSYNCARTLCFEPVARQSPERASLTCCHIFFHFYTLNFFCFLFDSFWWNFFFSALSSQNSSAAVIILCWQRVEDHLCRTFVLAGLCCHGRRLRTLCSPSYFTHVHIYQRIFQVHVIFCIFSLRSFSHFLWSISECIPMQLAQGPPLFFRKWPSPHKFLQDTLLLRLWYVAICYP